jgi:rhodanese-related sulfurtransferase
MDGSKPPSIFPQDLYDAIGTAGAPILIDVRRGAAFAADNRMIVGAIRRSPDEIQNWRPELPSGRAVVVYCVHGHEVSQDTASALALAAHIAEQRFAFGIPPAHRTPPTSRHATRIIPQYLTQ